MKLSLSIIFSSISFLMLTLSAFAHEAEIPHEELVPTINPVLFIGLALGLAIGGFIVWKFVLNKKQSPVSKQN